MRLTVAPGRGSLATFTLTVDGRSTTLVSDPANDCRPAVELATWVADAGGAAPLPLDPPKGMNRAARD